MSILTSIKYETFTLINILLTTFRAFELLLKSDYRVSKHYIIRGTSIRSKLNTYINCVLQMQ